MVYCWMVAIVRVGDKGEDQLVCSGTLVNTDLVVTSASCINM